MKIRNQATSQSCRRAERPCRLSPAKMPTSTATVTTVGIFSRIVITILIAAQPILMPSANQGDVSNQESLLFTFPLAIEPRHSLHRYGNHCGKLAGGRVAVDGDGIIRTRQGIVLGSTTFPAATHGRDSHAGQNQYREQLH